MRRRGFTLVSKEGIVRLTAGEAVAPDVRLTGPAEPAIGVLVGRISPTIGAKRGVTVEGATDRLAGLRPRGGRPPTATSGARVPQTPGTLDA